MNQLMPCSRRRFLAGVAAVLASPVPPARPDDRDLIAMIAEARRAWDLANQSIEDEADDGGLSDFWVCEDIIRALSARTVAGVLAKVEFYVWYADEAGSDNPRGWGLAAAVRDLKGLVAKAEARP